MRILLIQPYWYIIPEELTVPPEPLGLEYIVSIIPKEHIVEVFDTIIGEHGVINIDNIFIDNNNTKVLRLGITQKEIENKIKSFKPDVVGISALFYSQDKALKEVCQSVKNVNNNIKVVVGGSYPSSYKKFLKENPNVDYVVIGEGEITFKELLESNFRNLERINSIAYRDKDEVIFTEPREKISCLDTIPYPKRNKKYYSNYIKIQRYLFWNTAKRKPKWFNKLLNDKLFSWIADFVVNNILLKIGRTYQKIPKGYIVTTRGCPLNCNFCVVHYIVGNKLRKRSVSDIIHEIKILKREYGVKHIEIVDDNFNFSKKRTVKLCKKLKKLHISWRPASGIYVQSVDEEVLKWMKKSGCRHINIAIESGKPETLKNIIGKNIDLKHAKEVIRMSNEIGFFTEAFFILGLPGEAKKDMIQTIKYAVDAKIGKARLYSAVPFPGTRLYKECERKGYLSDNYDISNLQVTTVGCNANPAMINTEEFSSDDVVKMRTIGYKALKERNFNKYKAELESI